MDVELRRLNGSAMLGFAKGENVGNKHEIKEAQRQPT